MKIRSKKVQELLASGNVEGLKSFKASLIEEMRELVKHRPTQSREEQHLVRFWALQDVEAALKALNN